ncbi:MAG: hypothetical protein PHU65_08365 [Actinomycetota bacterium]|jgi:ABC-type Na+ efflux pump permease subunit|nr:hypothetical protein [Actinomycetota bacterium]
MKDIILVTVNSIKNNLRSKTLIIVLPLVIIMIAIGLALFFCLLLIAPEVNSAAPDKVELSTYLGLITYTTALLTLGINQNVFVFQPMVREKTRGNIESLLVTPLGIKNIWMAKSLSVLLPGMILAGFLSIAALFLVNYIYFVPDIGFLYTHWMGLNTFIGAPLIYFALSMLSHLIALIGKPASGNIIGQISLPVILTLMINMIMHNFFDINSWTFFLLNFSIAAIITIIAIILLPKLTKERIVLSI